MWCATSKPQPPKANRSPRPTKLALGIHFGPLVIMSRRCDFHLIFILIMYFTCDESNIKLYSNFEKDHLEWFGFMIGPPNGYKVYVYIL